MTLTLQPVRVANGIDEEGMLVFDEQRRLLAVLTHLSDSNEVAPGQWFLEAGFGRLEGGGELTPYSRIWTQPGLGSVSTSREAGEGFLTAWSAGPARVESLNRPKLCFFP